MTDKHVERVIAKIKAGFYDLIAEVIADKILADADRPPIYLMYTVDAGDNKHFAGVFSSHEAALAYCDKNKGPDYWGRYHIVDDLIDGADHG